MLKEQLFILFFTFNIPNLFCQITLDPGESVVEVKLFHQHMMQYSQPCYNTFPEIVDDGACNSQPFRGMSSCDEQSHSQNCLWLGSTNACISTTGNHEVLWVSKGKILYGENKSCPADRGFHVISTAPDPLAVYHCTCVKRNLAIYIGEFRSRENESYAIVALRFKLHNNVFYIQPAEKRVGSDSENSTAEVSWIPLPYYPTVHFITLENRNFFGDNLKLEDGYVLTGLKFNYMEATTPKIVKGFGINIRGVRYNPSNASLDPTDFMVVEPLADAERYPSPALEWPPGLPPRMINTKTYETRDYVTLERSSLEKDFGQTTVPKFHNMNLDDDFPLLYGFGIDFMQYQHEEGISFVLLLPYSYVD